MIRCPQVRLNILRSIRKRGQEMPFNEIAIVTTFIQQKNNKYMALPSGLMVSAQDLTALSLGLLPSWGVMPMVLLPSWGLMASCLRISSLSLLSENLRLRNYSFALRLRASLGILSPAAYM